MAALNYDPENPLHVQERSWVGDAVLALVAREWILANGPKDFGGRSDYYRNLTSNDFLSTLGVPSKVEAELGNIYLAGGLDAARAAFDERFIPLFKKQELKRRRRLGRV